MDVNDFILITFAFILETPKKIILFLCEMNFYHSVREHKEIGNIYRWMVEIVNVSSDLDNFGSTYLYSCNINSYCDNLNLINKNYNLLQV